MEAQKPACRGDSPVAREREMEARLIDAPNMLLDENSIHYKLLIIRRD